MDNSYKAVFKRIRCFACGNFQLVTSSDILDTGEVSVKCIECDALLCAGFIVIEENSDTL